MFNVVYDPFLKRTTTTSEKNSCMTPFLLSVLSRASDNTACQNIGGRMHGPSPHLKFWGTVPPVPPRSPPLRLLSGIVLYSVEAVEALITLDQCRLLAR